MRSGQYAFRDRRATQGRVPPPVDPADQRRLPPARPVLQPVHRRAERGRHRGRPQDPGRSRRHRHRRLRPARRRRRRRALGRPEPPGGRLEPDAGWHRQPHGSNDCGACSGAAVRVGRRARSSSRAPTLRRRGARRRLGRSRRSSRAPGVTPVDAPGRRAPLWRRAWPSGSPPPRRRSRLLAVVASRGDGRRPRWRHGDASSSSPTASPTRATSARSCARPRRQERRRRASPPGSVDLFNPKVVRASAGALFHVPVVEATLDDVGADRAGD